MKVTYWVIAATILLGRAATVVPAAPAAADPGVENLARALKHFQQFTEAYKCVERARDKISHENAQNMFATAIEELNNTRKAVKEIKLPTTAAGLRELVDDIDRFAQQVRVRMKAVAAGQEGVVEVIEWTGGFGLFRNELFSIWYDLEDVRMAGGGVLAAIGSKRREALARTEAAQQAEQGQITPMQRDALLALLAQADVLFQAAGLAPEQEQLGLPIAPSRGSSEPGNQEALARTLAPDMIAQMKQNARENRERADHHLDEFRRTSEAQRKSNTELRKSESESGTEFVRESQSQKKQLLDLGKKLAGANRVELKEFCAKANSPKSGTDSTSRLWSMLQEARRQNQHPSSDSADESRHDRPAILPPNTTEYRITDPDLDELARNRIILLLVLEKIQSLEEKRREHPVRINNPEVLP